MQCERGCVRSVGGAAATSAAAAEVVARAAEIIAEIAKLIAGQTIAIARAAGVMTNAAGLIAKFASIIAAAAGAIARKGRLVAGNVWTRASVARIVVEQARVIAGRTSWINGMTNRIGIGATPRAIHAALVEAAAMTNGGCADSVVDTARAVAARKGTCPGCHCVARLGVVRTAYPTEDASIEVAMTNGRGAIVGCGSFPHRCTGSKLARGTQMSSRTGSKLARGTRHRSPHHPITKSGGN